jgi:hypothetical protein
MLLMNNIKNNKSSNDTCMFCPHQYSIHYSDDIHGLGSKDIKDVHRGFTYINPVNGGQFSCHGFRRDKTYTYELT